MNVSRPSSFARFLIGALVAALLIAAPALVFAQTRVPTRVRLVHPSCEGAITWAQLTDALRVELRTMGSDLADDSGAPARLVIDAACDAATSHVVVVLSHAESGRSVREEMTIAAGVDRARALALNLSELIRARWLSLETQPTVAASAPPIDVQQLRTELLAELRNDIARARPPPLAVVTTPTPRPAPPATPRTFFDLALGASMYPAAANAVGELRAGVSLPIGGQLRLGLELCGGGGWTGDPLGDVALAIAGGAASLRMGRVESTWAVEAGPRIDAGYVAAIGIPSAGAIGTTLDAAYFAVGVDARLRVRLARSPWLLVGLELGAALAGIDARADARRVTAQLGARVALLLGLAWSL